jgi:hypothetical protein
VFPTDVSVDFLRFGELEDETLLTARTGELVRFEPDDDGVYYTQGGVLELRAPDGERGASGEHALLEQVPVRVEARQRDELLCTVDLTLTRVAAG